MGAGSEKRPTKCSLFSFFLACLIFTTSGAPESRDAETPSNLNTVPQPRRQFRLIKVENRNEEPGLKEALDLMVGGFDKIANSGLLGDGLKGNWSNVYKDLDYVRDQINEIKKKEGEVDWKKPTKEFVATMEALATLGFKALEKLPYVQVLQLQ